MNNCSREKPEGRQGRRRRERKREEIEGLLNRYLESGNGGWLRIQGVSGGCLLIMHNSVQSKP